jgi:xanthine dehydrogenase accessory factor
MKTTLGTWNPIEIHQGILDAIETGCPFALATVLKSEGSTPQKVGVKALVASDGSILGTLGGGIMEGEAIRHAVEACQSHTPIVFDFQMNDTYNRNAGPICGGNMRVLIDPTVAGQRDVHAQVFKAIKRRERGILVTRIRHSHPMEVTQEWISNGATEVSPPPSGIESLFACLSAGVPRHFVNDSSAQEGLEELLVEPVVPSPLLLIVGGGHIGQALAVHAAWNGFVVAVIDDRPEFTNPSLFPEGTTLCCGDIGKTVAAYPVDSETYIALVNRGHKQDAEALEACIHSCAAYIGMVGSQRKVALVRKDFIAKSIATEEEFDQVFAPIGLDLGAITVTEIATSIMAQIISVRRKGCARPASQESFLR